ATTALPILPPCPSIITIFLFMILTTHSLSSILQMTTPVYFHYHIIGKKKRKAKNTEKSENFGLQENTFPL
ncbi:MAG: hypothetical protein RR930_06255, partial [Clostridium sp.]